MGSEFEAGRTQYLIPGAEVLQHRATLAVLCVLIELASGETTISHLRSNAAQLRKHVVFWKTIHILAVKAVSLHVSRSYSA